MPQNYIAASDFRPVQKLYEPDDENMMCCITEYNDTKTH